MNIKDAGGGVCVLPGLPPRVSMALAAYWFCGRHPGGGPGRTGRTAAWLGRLARQPATWHAVVCSRSAAARRVVPETHQQRLSSQTPYRGQAAAFPNWWVIIL